MTFKRVYRDFCVFFLVAIAAVAAHATTIVMPTDDQLIAKSPLIVTGIVLNSQAVERNGGIWTETNIAVQQELKGTAGSTLTIREVGGVIGDKYNIVFGSPQYTAGEKVLVFATPTPRNDYQTTDLFVGKFTDRSDVKGRHFWFRDELASNTMLLDSKLQPVVASNTQRVADAFETYIQQKVGGLDPDAGYRVTNPQFQPALTAEFTLIAEPQIYRWFTFDTGGSAVWKSFGTQPGFANGGVSELQTGMGIWTNDTQAKIHYTYGGTTSTHGGLGTANGVNEVLFNDPNSEISGTFNPSTGGVVGEGGFNNVSSAPNWTSTFTADSTHTQKTWTNCLSIVEGNLVIQDGVTPSAGISSSVLAEIIGHELGHTLGFGHSSDPSALMYASVSPGGASLRSDDQTAARWLYPNGSAPPPAVPAAPTGLAVSASSSTQAHLTWSESSTGLTAQTIYMALGGGAFSRQSNPPANATSATVSGLTAGQTYRFEVTASNATGESARSSIASVTMPAAPGNVQAVFTVSPTSGTVGVTNFQFTNSSTGTITSRSWSFGDGSTSAVSSPSHVYSTTGTFSVMLTVVGSSNQSSISHSVVVSAVTTPPAAPSAAFSFSPTSATTGQTVNFTDHSTGTVTSWSWKFGDGTTSSNRSPSRQYTTAGTFSVMLTVSGSSGSSSVSHSITVSNGTPPAGSIVANFSFSPSSGTVGQSISFSDTSTGSPTSWSWSFGDGSTSTQQRPAHSYSVAGNYTVSLTARNASSSASASHAITIGNASSSSFQSLIPAAAQTVGAGSSFWRTEMTLFNDSAFAANLDFVFLPAGGGTPISRSTVLGPNGSLTYDNVLPQLFSLGSGTGAIAIAGSSTSGAPDIRISSRTFTTGSSGTYGQFVPDVASSLPATMYVTGMDSTASYRTNVGLVNQSTGPVNVTATLWDANGSSIGTATRTLVPRSFQQYGLSTLFPAAGSSSHTGMSMRVSANVANAVTSYASIIDNRTEDPVFVPAAGTSANQETIIPAVAHLSGGDGTFWRSDVSLFNPGTTAMSATLRLWVSDQDNRSAGGRNVSIPAGQTVRIPDVVTWIGAGAVKGALDIVTSGSSLAPIVTSRTYTTRTGDNGTYGQWIPGLASATFSRDGLITGLRSDATSRVNLGFVNDGSTPISVALTLITATGQTFNGFVTVQPKSETQGALQSIFPAVNTLALGNFTIRAHTDSAATLFASGSVIDNNSGDPSFIGGN